MQILLYILGVFLILIFLSTLFLFFLWTWTILKTRVPFVMVPNYILPYIHKALNIKEESVVYDLGCGDGRMLFYSAKLMPKAKYFGIENGPFPLLMSKIYQWSKGRKNKGQVKIINKDFFNQDLTDATHVFMYLYPNIMDDLLKKFDKELKKGTRVVSVSFQFTLKRPIAEIDLGRHGFMKLSRKLYVYEF